MKRIKKAVIPAAGYGTRFLPATKATPKEMLPIVDKPTIQYIVEEAKKSPIVFDKDCEELSPSMVKAFRSAAVQRNRRRHNA